MVLTLLLTAIGCADDEPAGESDAGSDATTNGVLAAELDAAGISPGRFAIDGDQWVCSRVIEGAAGVDSTMPFELDVLVPFVLEIRDGDLPVLAARNYELEMRWVDDCLIFEKGTDSATDLSDGCDTIEESCLPFSLIQICGADLSPSLFARIPDCGQNSFALSAL